MVDDLLCIEFDGTATDSEAFPTSLCLTGFTAHPYSPAAQAARHLLGETLCRAADEMVCEGDAEREVHARSNRSATPGCARGGA